MLNSLTVIFSTIAVVLFAFCMKKLGSRQYVLGSFVLAGIVLILVEIVEAPM